MSSPSPSLSSSTKREAGKEKEKEKEKKELDEHEAIARLQALMEEGEWVDEATKAMAIEIIQEVDQILKDTDDDDVSAEIETPEEEEETVTREPDADDGFSWVNYWSEVVPQFAHPRVYYRCAHTGCNARREVQQVDGEDSPVYRVTYVNGHTCKPVVPPLSRSIPPIDSTEVCSLNQNVDEIHQHHQHSYSGPP